MFLALVDTKDTTSAVEQLVKEFKVKLDEVKTQVEEDAEIIVEFRKDAIDELKQINQELDLYSKENQEKINTIITTYEALINKAETTIKVLELVEEAAGLLKNIPTALDEAKAQAIEDIEAYYATIDLTDYTGSNSSKIRVLVASAKAKVNAAKTIEVIEELVANLKKDIASIETLSSSKEELENAKKEAIEDIENYKNLDDFSASDKEELEALIVEYKAKISAATTLENINSLKEELYSKMDKYEADPFGKLREEAYKEAVQYAKEKGIKEGNNQLTTLLEKLEDDLEKAKTSTKIDELFEGFKLECDKLVKDNTSFSCMNATYVSSIILIFSLAFVLISKKR